MYVTAPPKDPATGAAALLSSERFKPGRPSMRGVVDRALTDNTPAFVFACGPERLVNEAWDCVNSERRRHKGAPVEFRHEVFDF